MLTSKKIWDLVLFLFFFLDMYGLEEGGIPATFFVLYVIGWKPHESQVNNNFINGAYANNDMAAILVFQNNEMAGMLVY